MRTQPTSQFIQEQRELMGYNESLTSKVTEAERQLEELRKQEPVAKVTGMGGIQHLNLLLEPDTLLYARPIPPEPTGDAELRKQKPVWWILENFVEADGELVADYDDEDSVLLSKLKQDLLDRMGYHAVLYPVFAAPIPPTVTPSQQDALESLKTLTLWATTDRSDLSAEVKQLRGFILARPEVTK